MYRSPLDIYASILEHLLQNNDSSNVSKVCLYCKMSQVGLERYVASMTESGLVTDEKLSLRKRIFTITAKGKELLQAYKTFKNILESYNLTL